MEFVLDRICHLNGSVFSKLRWKILGYIHSSKHQ